MRELLKAKREAALDAVGPFSPVLFERYEHIGGERGWIVGHISETVTGQACGIWNFVKDRG